MSEEETQEEGYISWHWRNSQKTPRFWKFDARAGASALVVLLYPRRWTILLSILAMILFWILERKGLTFRAAIRAFRVWIIGPKRPAYIWTSRRKMIENE